MPRPVDKIKYPFRINQKIELTPKIIREAQQLLKKEFKRIYKKKYTDDVISSHMEAVEKAYDVRVCGITPTYGHNINNVANQCYLSGVPGAASGISHLHSLIFHARIPAPHKGEKEFNEVAIIINGFYGLEYSTKNVK